MPAPSAVEAIKNEGAESRLRWLFWTRAASHFTARLCACVCAGNELFRRARFGAAVDKYTEAIVMVAGAADQAALRAVLYCNRAMARRSLAPGDIDAWRTDAQLALEADRTNPKGHYLVGLADVAASEFSAGVRHLEEAREMAARQKKPPSLLKEFDTAIAVGRWKWHQHTEQADREQDFALRSYLDAAIGGLRDLELQRAMLDHHAAAAAGGAAASGARGGAATSAAAPARTHVASDRYSASCTTAPSAAGAAASATAASPTAGSGTATGTSDDDESLFGMAGDSAAGSRPGSRPQTTAAARAAAARAAYASAPSTSATPSTAAAAAGDNDAAAAVLEASVASIEQHHAERTKQVTALFDEREKERAARSVPDHFLCSITLDLMLDPVLAPSGVSYERAAITHYLSTVKGEDPTTRKPLTADQLYPNLALKSAITAWLALNPWAHPLLPADGSA